MTKSQPLVFPYTGEALVDSASTKRRYYEFNYDKNVFRNITGQTTTEINDKGEEVEAFETIDPYHPDSTLKETVELMHILERPLLLRGEPGCGKTRVAQAYAYERYKDEPEGYRRLYYEWQVK